MIKLKYRVAQMGNSSESENSVAYDVVAMKNYNLHTCMCIAMIKSTYMQVSIMFKVQGSFKVCTL